MGDMKPGDTGGGVGLGNWGSDALEAITQRDVPSAERDIAIRELAKGGPTSDPLREAAWQLVSHAACSGSIAEPDTQLRALQHAAGFPARAHVRAPADVPSDDARQAANQAAHAEYARAARTANRLPDHRDVAGAALMAAYAIDAPRARVAALTVERDELKAELDRLAKLVEPKDWKGWDQVDSIYEEARRLRLERDEAIRERDLAYARDEAVKNTLTNVGAPTHDEADRELTANGMLVDWLAGRRNPRWIGGEGAVIDELRGQVATLLEAIGRLYEYRKAGGKDISAGGLFQLLVGRADAIIERTDYAGGQG